MADQPVRINNCYDSHVHWAATGQFATRLSLHELKSANEIRNLKLAPHHYVDGWLFGFGWDQNKWPDKKYPNKEILDELFPDTPVVFTRVDGHAAWVNSLVLQKIGVLKDNGNFEVPKVDGGKFVVDEGGAPTGVLIDLAKSMVDQIVPQPDRNALKAYLLEGAKRFNDSGFTHIRDLTCDESQWNETCHLDEAGLLTIAVEQFFDAEDPANFHKALALAEKAKTQKLINVRPVGVKIYYDGALGSEGALISEPYKSGSGRGLALLNQDDLASMIRQCFEKNIDIAVHVIGDEAAHRAVDVAYGLKDKVNSTATLHLEHGQMLRPETVNMLKEIRAIVHLQPCHWLSDRYWLEDKIGHLKDYLFPWRSLEENDIPFDFGSDSPIETPSLKRTLEAVSESAMNGIPKLLGNPLIYHSHQDTTWVPNTFTEFDGEKPVQVVFRGEHLLV